MKKSAVKRGLPLLILFFTWLGLQADLPVTRPVLWFSFSAATASIYSAYHLVYRRKKFSVEFLFSLIIILAGIIRASELAWLKFAYFPVIISLAAFYSLRTIIPLSLLIPFLEVSAIIKREGLIEEAAFSFFIILTSAISALILGKLKKEKEKAEASFDTIKDNARNITPETGIESLSSDEIISHYFASMLKTDEEIKELLLTVKNAVFADSVNLFTPHGNSFSLRCSSEEKGGIITSGGGIISICIRDKKPFSSGELNDKKVELGYIRNGNISSIIAVPVMDGATATGVLTVDSSRYQAFSETEKNTVKMFADYLVRILERERIYLMIKRDVFGLKILKEESSNLVSSLNMEVIIAKLCKGAEKIASSRVFFFISKGRNFELIPYTGGVTESGRLFDLKGTFINMVIENKQPIYMSDVTNYRIPILPFKTEDIRSVLVIPMLYEDDLLGLFIMLSEKRNFIDTFQIDMLKVMCNQASTSIANAQLHAEIEKMATTDGLTGLFNHRLFQEKIAGEIKRLKRFSEPVSLLLADIDYFKKVNDTFGHPVGDTVLKGVAKIITGTIRDIDVPARYGGEEFAVILPGTDGEGGKQIAERIRKTVMDKSFSADGGEFKVTLSIGVATIPFDAKGKEELIEKADRALYQAKHAGRNQTILWSSIR